MEAVTEDDRPTVAASVPRWALPALLAAGLLIRLLLSPLGGYGYDMYILGEWSGHLYREPLAVFYAVADRPDHLPGDLWLLLLVVHLYHWLGPLTGSVDLESTLYEVFLKAVPALADLVIALMLFRIVRSVRDTRAGLLAAAGYALNPASIFLTAIWGQWDAVSMAMVLIAFELFLRGRWVWASPLLAWAVLIKPQLVLLAPLLFIKPVRDSLTPGLRPPEALRRLVTGLGPRIGLAALLAVVTLLALTLPWDIGLPGLPARWSLLERVDVALNLYQRTTMNAFNVWHLLAGAGDRPDDTTIQLFGITARTWGAVLFIAAYALIVVACWRTWAALSPAVVLAWGSLATTVALFMLPTRVHERYLFPALVFAVLVAGLRPRWWWFAAVLSLTYLLNLVYVYNRNNPFIFDEPLASVMSTDGFLRTVSLVNLLLLQYVLMLPGLFERTQVAERGATASGPPVAAAAPVAERGAISSPRTER